MHDPGWRRSASMSRMSTWLASQRLGAILWKRIATTCDDPTDPDEIAANCRFRSPASPPLCTGERIHQSDAAVAEVLHIARDDRQVMQERGRRDLLVELVLRMRHPQASPNLRCVRVECEDLGLVVA